MSESIVFVDMRKLEQSESCNMLVRFAKAENDISHIHLLFKRLEVLENVDNDCVDGMKLYLFMTLFSHMHEFLKLLTAVHEGKAKDEMIIKIIERNAEARKARDRLLEHGVKDETQKGVFLNNIRNRGGFHYYDHRKNELGEWIDNAIPELLIEDRDNYTPQGKYIEDGDKVRRHIYVDKIFEAIVATNMMGYPVGLNDYSEQYTKGLNMLLEIQSDVDRVCSAVTSHMINNFRTI